MIIEGYNNYTVSAVGEVRNKTTGQKIKPCNSTDGYSLVCLYNDKGRKTLRVGRIVAIAFLPNPKNKPCVNHIDGNKKNDCVENLEWATHSENEIHSFRVLGKRPNSPWLGKKNEQNHSSKNVGKYSLTGEFIESFPSISEAGRKGFNTAHISRVCQGKTKSHKGFIWKYIH